MRRLPRLVVALIAATCTIHAAAAQDGGAASPLVSSIIDPALFRDGEVQRSTEGHGAWTLVCDVIPRLGRRFRSLRSAPVALGTATVDLTVSTGDDGQPAALLRLPFGLALPSGVEIVSAGRRGRHHRVPIALCDETGCQAVWTLDAAELDALRHGDPLRLALQGWTPSQLFGAAAPPPMAVAVAGTGFPDALAASLK